MSDDDSSRGVLTPNHTRLDDTGVGGWGSESSTSMVF